MSKIFKYRQYHHAGYDEKNLVLPDDTTIFLTRSRRIDRQGTNECRYPLRGRTKLHSRLRSWYLFLDGIKMTDVPFPIRNIEECESPTGRYILFRQDKLNMQKYWLLRIKTTERLPWMNLWK